MEERKGTGIGLEQPRGRDKWIRGLSLMKICAGSTKGAKFLCGAFCRLFHTVLMAPLIYQFLQNQNCSNAVAVTWTRHRDTHLGLLLPEKSESMEDTQGTRRAQ